MECFFAASIAIMVIFILGATFLVFRRSDKAPGAPAVIAGAATITAALLTVAVSNYAAKARELEQQHRLQKIEVYEGFGLLITDIFALVKKSEGSPDSETINQELAQPFAKLSRELILWGSPEVIESFSAFREAALAHEASGGGEGSSDGVEIILLMDDVFRSMRSDLGLSNSGLPRGKLVRIFVTDPQSVPVTN